MTCNTSARAGPSRGEVANKRVRERKCKLSRNLRPVCIVVSVKAMFKQVVCSKLLVLVASEISLDDKVAVEAH